MPVHSHLFLPIDQCSVAVTTLPAAPGGQGLLVWLHGLGAASTITFANVAQSLRQAGISSLLIDLPGAGHSSAPENWGGAIEDLAFVALQAITIMADGPVVLFGHSMGGSVAIAATTQRPDVVQHLIVAEPNLDPGTGTISRTIARQGETSFVTEGFQQLVGATSRLARRGNGAAATWLTTLRMASPQHLHRAATSVRAPRKPTFRQQLIDLPMPVTTITGQHTPPLEPPLPQRKNLTGYVVPNAGHQMFDDNPAAFGAIMAEAMSRMRQ